MKIIRLFTPVLLALAAIMPGTSMGWGATPTNVRFTAVSLNSVTVEWSATSNTVNVMALSTTSDFSVIASSGLGVLNQTTTGYTNLQQNTTYFFKVKELGDPDSAYSTPISTRTPTLASTTSSPTIQTQALSEVSAYPNPFDSRINGVSLRYVLNVSAKVNITIFDAFGQVVKEFEYFAGETGATAGVNRISWDGRSENGNKVGKGVYLCVVETPTQRETFKLGVLH